MKRKIIKIDEERCDGCGNCIPDCPEGALQMIDGKARLVSDLFCDGLGACMGACPRGAITVEEREALPYDEKRVMESIIPQGPGVIRAHLLHLREHGEFAFLRQAIEALDEKGIDVPDMFRQHASGPAASFACPGSLEVDMRGARPADHGRRALPQQKSELRQWPVQLKLVNPAAPYFQDADLLIAADCAPVAFGGFHEQFLKNKTVIIFCPKLDPYGEEYIEKLAAVFSTHTINSVTMVRMEVPCCGGVGMIVQKAMEKAGKNIPVHEHVVGINGELQ
ncbi:MAG TPA: 4Fe-4S dicluster domain-containing protein [Spirochaetes bacterium]|nr:4Fe-4S dicluster domain-containing protein [Spirochaetota bacterium]